MIKPLFSGGILPNWAEVSSLPGPRAPPQPQPPPTEPAESQQGERGLGRPSRGRSQEKGLIQEVSQDLSHLIRELNDLVLHFHLSRLMLSKD